MKDLHTSIESKSASMGLRNEEAGIAARVRHDVSPRIDGPRSARDPRPVSPAKIPLQQDSALNVASALAATVERDFAASLAQEMRTSVQITAHSVQETGFGKLLKSIPEPRSLWTLGTGASAAINLSPSVIFGLLSRLLGCTQPPGAAPTRSLTALEQRLLHGPLERAAGRFAEALGMNSTALCLGSPTTESSSLIAPLDLTIVMEFDVRLETTAGSFTLAIRREFLQKIVNGALVLSIEKGAPPPPALASAHIELGAIAARTTLTPEELRDLQVGDIITTAVKSGGRIELDVDSGPTLSAELVQFHGKRALVRTKLSDSEARR